jgi:hypothetical protein
MSLVHTNMFLFAATTVYITSESFMVQRKKLSSIDKQSEILLIITFYLFLRNEIFHIFWENKQIQSYYPYSLLVLEYVPIIIISVGLECSSSLFSKLKNKENCS